MMPKKIWEKMLSIMPEGKVGKGICVALLLFAGIVGYCWVAHLLSIL